MNCAEDLTADDLNGDVSSAVLERVSAGEGSNVNLWGQIDRDNVTGLNLEDPLSAPKVIKTWDDRLTEEGVESCVDDELILHIPFIHSLRLRTLLLNAPAPGHPYRPGRLRMYINHPRCPGFDDLEYAAALMDVNISSPPPGARRLADGRREVEEWGLKVHKLASVHSVTLLLTEANTGAKSAMWYVGFKGDPKNDAVDMSKWGQVPAHTSADQSVDQVGTKQGSGYTTIR